MVYSRRFIRCLCVTADNPLASLLAAGSKLTASTKKRGLTCNITTGLANGMADRSHMNREVHVRSL